MVLDVSRTTASSARWRQRKKHKHISWSCKRLQYLLMCKNDYRLKCEQRIDRKERNKDNSKKEKKQTRQRESVCNKQTCVSLVLVVIPAHRNTFGIEQASTILTWRRCWSCQISQVESSSEKIFVPGLRPFNVDACHSFAREMNKIRFQDLCVVSTLKGRCFASTLSELNAHAMCLSCFLRFTFVSS